MRARVLAFVLAATGITYAVGALVLFLLNDVGATGPHHLTPSAALDLGFGLLLLGFAVYLRRKQPAPAKSQGTSKIERYLQSTRLAFVLGITLYVLPSPIYIAAVKEVSDANLSDGGKLLSLLVTVAVMLWLIELPMLALLLYPARASSSLDRINAWFARHGRLLAVLACAAAGAYLSVKGLLGLIS